MNKAPQIAISLAFALCAGAACSKSRDATPRQDEALVALAHTPISGLQRVNAKGGPRLRGLEDGVLRIWPMGDSITQGVAGGYRNGLFRRLRKDDVRVDYVGTLNDEATQVPDRQHEGHSGFIIGNARENIDQWLTKLERPEVILIMLGTNDFAWWTNKGVPEHYADLTDLLDHALLKLPDATLIVATIPPQTPKLIESIKLDRGSMTDQYNQLIRKALPAHPAYGKRLFLADVAAKLTLADLTDGIHPSAAAHEKIADVFYATLKGALAR